MGNPVSEPVWKNPNTNKSSRRLSLAPPPSSNKIRGNMLDNGLAEKDKSN